MAKPCGSITYSSDTDFTPFDKGAYASSTTYISGRATVIAAEQVAAQIREVAARMLSQDGGSVKPEDITLRDGACRAPDGRSVTHRGRQPSYRFQVMVENVRRRSKDRRDRFAATSKIGYQNFHH